jgi:hypothetical protein
MSEQPSAPPAPSARSKTKKTRWYVIGAVLFLGFLVGQANRAKQAHGPAPVVTKQDLEAQARERERATAALLAAGFKPEQLDRAAMEPTCKAKGFMPVEMIDYEIPGAPHYWKCDDKILYQDAPQTFAMCESRGLEHTTTRDAAGKTVGACKRKEEEKPVGVWKTKGGYIAATNVRNLNRGVEIVASGDKEAFALFVNSTPGVFILRAGLEVSLVETNGMLASEVKVRRRGTLQEFWTVREALDSP